MKAPSVCADYSGAHRRERQLKQSEIRVIRKMQDHQTGVRHMNCKRGKHLAALNLSGPHSSALFNEVEEEIIIRLEKFNAWVEMFNALNTELWQQHQRCTWVCFTRFQRDLILRWCDEEQCWELDALINPGAGQGGCPAAPNGPDDGAGGGDHVELTISSDFELPKPERPARPAAAARGRRRPPAGQAAKRPVKKGRDAAAVAAERVGEFAAAAQREGERIVLRTRALLRSVRRSPRLRHMRSQFEFSVGEMKAVGRLTRDTIRALAHKAQYEIARAIVDVRCLFIEPLEPQPQPALWEARRYEIRPGFALVLYNFEGERPNWDAWLFGKLEIEIDYPNWESWLFGRPADDEQKVA